MTSSTVQFFEYSRLDNLDVRRFLNNERLQCDVTIRLSKESGNQAVLLLFQDVLELRVANMEKAVGCFVESSTSRETDSKT